MGIFKTLVMSILQYLSRFSLQDVLVPLLVSLFARMKGAGPRPRSRPRPRPRPLVIFILGAPGVGKGTQSRFIRAAVPGLTHLSYGDLARYQDQIPGSWISSFPRREGSNRPLLPARDAVELLRNTIETGVKQHGQMVWLVDGLPRHEQHVAEWTAQMPQADCALYLFCPPEVSSERVRERGQTSGRPEDADPEKARERVWRANAESEPMLNALEQSGTPIIRVDANRDLNTVKREVVNHIKEVIRRWEQN